VTISNREAIGTLTATDGTAAPTCPKPDRTLLEFRPRHVAKWGYFPAVG
jgi:hypothetical protein